MGNAKGMTLLEAVKFLRARRDEAEAVISPKLHWYLDGQIRPSGWYPEADLVELIRACARLLPGDPDRVLELMGELSVRSQTEIYSDLLLGGTSTSRVFALWKTQHDTGEMVMTPESPERMRIELVDFADPTREFCLLLRGYFKGVVVINGGTDPAVEKVSCRIWGDESCVWRASWKLPEGHPLGDADA